MGNFILLENGVKQYEFDISHVPFLGDDVLHRVALGELKESKHRSALTPGCLSYDWNSQSGSIGFMDVVKRKRYVPSNTQEPYSLLNQELSDVLAIFAIGIEEPHKFKGHGKYLLSYAEEIARQRGLHGLVADTIQQPSEQSDPRGLSSTVSVRNMLQHAGYALYVKRGELFGYKPL